VVVIIKSAISEPPLVLRLVAFKMSALSIMIHRSSVCNHTNYFRKCSLFTKITTFCLCEQRVGHHHPPHLTMSLWVDKHRPRTLEKLTYNNSLSKSLKAIVPPR
jgi:hypothetical protein